MTPLNVTGYLFQNWFSGNKCIVLFTYYSSHGGVTPAFFENAGMTSAVRLSGEVPNSTPVRFSNVFETYDKTECDVWPPAKRIANEEKGNRKCHSDTSKVRFVLGPEMLEYLGAYDKHTQICMECYVCYLLKNNDTNATCRRNCMLTIWAFPSYPHPHIPILPQNSLKVKPSMSGNKSREPELIGHIQVTYCYFNWHQEIASGIGYIVLHISQAFTICLGQAVEDLPDKKCYKNVSIRASISLWCSYIFHIDILFQTEYMNVLSVMVSISMTSSINSPLSIT